MDNSETNKAFLYQRYFADIRGERMEALKHFLAVEMPRATLVHFEMASFVETNFVANLTRTLLPYVDSIGEL